MFLLSKFGLKTIRNTLTEDWSQINWTPRSTWLKTSELHLFKYGKELLNVFVKFMSQHVNEVVHDAYKLTNIKALLRSFRYIKPNGQNTQ